MMRVRGNGKTTRKTYLPIYQQRTHSYIRNWCIIEFIVERWAQITKFSAAWNFVSFNVRLMGDHTFYILLCRKNEQRRCISLHNSDWIQRRKHVGSSLQVWESCGRPEHRFVWFFLAGCWSLRIHFQFSYSFIGASEHDPIGDGNKSIDINWVTRVDDDEMCAGRRPRQTQSQTEMKDRVPAMAQISQQKTLTFFHSFYLMNVQFKLLVFYVFEHFFSFLFCLRRRRRIVCSRSLFLHACMNTLHSVDDGGGGSNVLLSSY